MGNLGEERVCERGMELSQDGGNVGEYLLRRVCLLRERVAKMVAVSKCLSTYGEYSSLAASECGTRCTEDNLRWAQFPDAKIGEPVAHIDTGLDRLALDDTSAETSGESVTIWI
jgi:hypothetical protein